MGYLGYTLIPSITDLIGLWSTTLFFALLLGMVALGVIRAFNVNIWVGGIIAILVCLAFLVVGVGVVSNIQTSLGPSSGVSGMQASSLGNTFSSTYNSFGLLAVVAIVVIFMVIVYAMFTLIEFASGRYMEGAG